MLSDSLKAQISYLTNHYCKQGQNRERKLLDFTMCLQFLTTFRNCKFIWDSANFILDSTFSSVSVWDTKEFYKKSQTLTFIDAITVLQYHYLIGWVTETECMYTHLLISTWAPASRLYYTQNKIQLKGNIVLFNSNLWNICPSNAVILYCYWTVPGFLSCWLQNLIITAISKTSVLIINLMLAIKRKFKTSHQVLPSYKAIISIR